MKLSVKFLIKSIFLLLLLAFLLLIVFVLVYDGKEKKLSCPALIEEDGFVEVKLIDSGIPLRLPAFSDIRRQNSNEEFRGCGFAKYLSITYLWHENELISEGINRFKVPKGQSIKVNVSVNSSGTMQQYLNRQKELREHKRPWRFDNPIDHYKYPLKYYPKYYWDDPNNPSEFSLKRSRNGGMWGVKETKHKNGHDQSDFTALCAIPAKNKFNPSSRIEAEMAKFGDSKCLVRIILPVNGGRDYIHLRLAVWAYLGSDQQGIIKLNKIADAVVEEFQSYIKG